MTGVWGAHSNPCGDITRDHLRWISSRVPLGSTTDVIEGGGHGNVRSQKSLRSS